MASELKLEHKLNIFPLWQEEEEEEEILGSDDDEQEAPSDYCKVIAKQHNNWQHSLTNFVYVLIWYLC